MEGLLTIITTICVAVVSHLYGKIERLDGRLDKMELLLTRIEKRAPRKAEE